jgi:hypothetical protein
VVSFFGSLGKEGARTLFIQSELIVARKKVLWAEFVGAVVEKGRNLLALSSSTRHVYSYVRMSS